LNTCITGRIRTGAEGAHGRAAHGTRGRHPQKQQPKQQRASGGLAG